jgi:tetratricopeptide (TPR) repeat protein
MKGNGLSSAPLTGALSFFVAVAAIWLAVATQSWAETLLVAGVALIYLVSPPSGNLPRPVLVLFGLALLLALVGFLPIGRWEGSMRQPFLDHGITLPALLSAQPWWSLEDTLLLFASLLWAWNCFEARFSLHQRKSLLAAFLAAAAAVALASVLRGTAYGLLLPGWLLQIGQFPNRNQTGDVLVLAGVGCFARAISDVANRKSKGMVWMGLTGLFAAAIVQNDSRGAAALFGLGLLLIFALLGKLRRPGLVSWSVAGLFLVVFACLIYYQGSALVARFRDLGTSEQGGRTLIYADALHLIGRCLLFGVGLGNFSGFYNVDRPHTGAIGWYALHPESDWFWVAAELGLGGVVVFGLLVFYAFRLYLRESPFPALTRAATAIAIVFLIHTLFDVGGHRMGAVWPCLFLVGLGSFRSAAVPVYHVPRIFLRLAGLLLFIVALLRFQSLSLAPWMPTRGSLAEVEDAVVSDRPTAQQQALLDRAVAWAPLDWKLYFQRGLVEEHAGNLAPAWDDFHRSLFLSPSSVVIPLSVAEACRRDGDWRGAMQAWAEACRRSGERAGDTLNDIMENPGLDERTRLQLTTLAGDNRELQLIALVELPPEDFDWSRENFLAANPSLDGISPALQRRFFDRWANDGDAAKLADEWLQHPEWESVGWRGHARALARVGLYDAAVAAALQELPTPKLPNVPPMPERDALENYLTQPKDPFAGIELYLAQKASGKNDEALKTLQSVAQLPDAPAFVPYLLTRDLLATGQNQAAWEAIEPLLDRP